MTLRQVEGHTFFSDGISSRSVVLDLGANHGNFSHELIRHFDCHVYAVEANPELCQAIACHPKLQLTNAAVAGKAGKTAFYISNRSDQSSSIVAEHAGSTARKIEIQTVTLAELIERFANPIVDLLKVDIEGAEIEMFEATPDGLLQRCTQITVEFHDFCGIISKNVAARAVDRIERLGFDVIQMWMRSHGDTLFVNRSCANVTTAQLAWNRFAVKNWWWLCRKFRRQSRLQWP